MFEKHSVLTVRAESIKKAFSVSKILTKKMTKNRKKSPKTPAKVMKKMKKFEKDWKNGKKSMHKQKKN